MSTYEDTIANFLKETQEIGIRIHNDYQNAKTIFEAIEKNINFDSLISQTTSPNLLRECNAFGGVIMDWIEQYPKVLGEYNKILKIVIDDLKQIQGLTVSQGNNSVRITLNDKEFLYHFNDNIHSDSPNLVISDADKVAITQEENKIVQEIAEILSLDLYIFSLLGYVEVLNNKHNIRAVAFSLKSISSVSSPELIKDLTSTATWWAELRTMLDKLKKITQTAVEIDEQTSKQLGKIFNQEANMKARDAKMRAAKAGMSLLGNIALNFIPGGTVISATIEAYHQRKTYKEALDALRK